MKKYTRAAVIMCLVMCFAAVMSVFSFAAEINLTDIDGHWAKEYIEYGVNKGYINGYTDNTFRPNKTVTRAEFSKMINSALKITGTEVSDFADVADKDWFSAEVKHALYAGYIKGYEDNTFRPNNPISRQEAAVIFSRIVLPTSKRASLDMFKDNGEIADWAKDAVGLIAHKGYMKGDQNSNVLPKGNLTRAEAAKLISELVKNETVVNGVQQIKKGQTISQAIFTDGMVVSCEEDAEIFLVDCRVLGDIEVKSGMIVMSLGNTAAQSITNNCADDLTVMVDEQSNISELTVCYPMLVMGDNVETVILEGENLQAGSVEFDGGVGTVDVNSSAIIKVSEGKIENLNLNKSVNCVVQSGTVKNLTVSENAKGSVITLAQKVTVDSAVNKAAVTYYGQGEIKKADNLVDGVTYETAPKEVTGKQSASTENDEEGEKTETDKTVDENFFAELTISPASKKTGVSVSSNVVLTFDAVVYDKDGEKLTAEYIEDNITLRKTTATGTKVAFDATVNSTKKLTINPSSSLSEGVKYYLVIPEGVFTYSSGSTNPKFTSYFTTAADEDDEEGMEDESGVTVTFTPKNKETKVETDTLIVINFSEKMYAAGGDTLTADHVEDNIEIRKTSASGTKISYNAAVASTGKKITLAPKSDFADGTKYYVIIPEGTLENGDGDELSKQSIYFTTASSSDDEEDEDEDAEITFSPKKGETKVEVDELITITFSEKMYKTNGKVIDAEYVEDEIELRKGSASGSTVSFEASVPSTGKKITIAPTKDLSEGTKYYVIVPAGAFFNGDDESVSKTTSYFTTKGASSDDEDFSSDELGVTITPADGSKNVVQNPAIELTFTEPIVRTNGKEVTKEYIEDNVVELRKTSKTGSKVDFSASISTNSRKVVIHPINSLTAGAKYCVVIKSETVMGSDSEIENDEVITYFTVASATTPTVLPASGTSNVSVGTDIVVTFGNDTIYTSSSSERELVDEEYIKNNEVVTLYRNTTSGTVIPCDVEVNAALGKVTLTPKSALSPNYRYYISVKSAKIYNSSKKAFAGITTYFDTNERMLPEFDPDDGDDEFAVDESMTITFDEPVYNTSGIRLTKTYLKDEVIRLYRGTEEDDDNLIEDLTATISSDNKTITVTPDEDLEGNTEYLLVLVAGTIANDEDDKNARHAVVFTTENFVNKTVTITPANAKTDVGTNVNPTIEFKTKVLTADGDPVDDIYAAENITLREKSKTGAIVPAEVEVSDDGKTFTIIPYAELTPLLKYYIVIPSGSFVYNDKKTAVAAKSSYFTVIKGDNMPKITINDDFAINKNSITITFGSNVAGKAYFVYQPADGSVEEQRKMIQCYANDDTSITISSLKPGTEYIIRAYITTGVVNSVEKVLTIKTEAAEADACIICGEAHSTDEHPCDVCKGKGHASEACDKKCTICNGLHLTEDHECDNCGEDDHKTEDCPNHCDYCEDKHPTSEHVCSEECGEKGHEGAENPEDCPNYCEYCEEIPEDHAGKDEHPCSKGCDEKGHEGTVDPEDCPNYCEYCEEIPEDHAGKDEHPCSKGCGEKGHEGTVDPEDCPNYCEYCEEIPDDHNGTEEHPCSVCEEEGHDGGETCPLYCDHCDEAVHDELDHFCTKCGIKGHQGNCDEYNTEEPENTEE